VPINHQKKKRTFVQEKPETSNSSLESRESFGKNGKKHPNEHERQSEKEQRRKANSAHR